MWNNNTPAAYMSLSNYRFNTSHTSCECFNFTPPYPCYTEEPLVQQGEWLLYNSLACCPAVHFYTNISTEVLYLTGHEKHKCTLVKVSNLAEPDWKNINCFDKLLPNVVCAHSKQFINITTDVNKNNIGQQVMCPPHAMSINKTCCTFIWIDASANDSTKSPGKKRMREVYFAEVKEVRVVFESANADYPPLVTSAEHETLVLSICRKLFVLHKCSHSHISCNEATGFQVFKSHKKTIIDAIFFLPARKVGKRQ